MDADSENTAKPRRWFRFSLRRLLILVTLLSVPLGWIGWRLGQARRERATIAWIEEMGGEVAGPSWFSGRVTRVNLQFTKARDVSPLAGLKSLEILSLYSTEVADVSPLALKSLDLTDTPVSKLDSLATLKNLRELRIGYTQVSNLSPLIGLKTLDKLYLESTPVSEEQVQWLKQAFPHCQVFRIDRND
jgi:Leucine-rich repeat (LRR) protein